MDLYYFKFYMLLKIDVDSEIDVFFVIEKYFLFYMLLKIDADSDFYGFICHRDVFLGEFK